MALIKEKKIEIGKLVIVWDWFEATKWLNFLNGILFFIGMMTIFMIEKGVIQKKTIAILLIIICFVLIWIVGYAVNIIRKESL